jgi:acetyl esterase/lipase
MWLRRFALPCYLLAACIILLGQVPAPLTDVEIARGIAYTQRAEGPLLLDLYLPAARTTPTPVVLALHGGSWMSNDRRELGPLAECLAGQGYAVISADYRLAPRAVFPAQRDDARDALRWTAAHAKACGFDLQHLVVLGLSAGGQLAMLLGVDRAPDLPRPCAVVDLFGPSDFTGKPPDLKSEIAVQIYLGAEQQERPALYATASPIRYVTPDDPPFLIVHGEQDTVVPFDQSTRMTAALKKAGVPVTFHPVPGMGHLLPTTTLPEGRIVLRHVLDFLALQCHR